MIFCFQLQSWFTLPLRYVGWNLAYIIWGGGGNWKMDLVLGGKGIIEEKGVVKREGEMIVLSQFFLSWDKKTHKA